MSKITIYPEFFDNHPIDSINGVSLILDRIKDFPDQKYNLYLLSNQEIERYWKFHKSIDREVFAVSHIELRRLIAKTLNIEIDTIVIDFPKHKKPLLQNRNSDFSLSHSNDIFAIGICSKEGMKIGIDIEKIVEIQNIDDICKTQMHDMEAEFINASDGTEKLKRFLICWTRKEAILKMLGIGLINELNSVCTIGNSNAIVLDIPNLDFPNRINATIYTKIGNDYVISCSISKI